MEDFNINFDISLGDEDVDKRYITPKKIRSIKDRMIKYSNAVKLA